VIIQDADLEYDPAEYPALLQPILDNKADVVFGSRFLRTASRPAVLAFGWEPHSDKPVQHAYRSEPDGYGNLL